MDIKALETHRIGDRVHLDIYDDTDTVIYDRYVDAADWDADPQAIVASIADYLSNRPVEPEIVLTMGAKPVSMTSDEVSAKLSEIALQKANDSSISNNIDSASK